jgi:hypothetical protein
MCKIKFKCYNCGVNLLSKRVFNTEFIIINNNTEIVCSSCFYGKYLSKVIND